MFTDDQRQQTELLLALSFLLALNVAFFVGNLIVLCSRGKNQHTPDHEEHTSVIKNFQIYFSSHLAAPSSSVVLSAVDAGSRAVSLLPDSVTCVSVVPHRKMFLCKVSWSADSTGFLKECLNPFEIQLHSGLQHDNIVSYLWCKMGNKPEIEIPASLTPLAPPALFYCMELCQAGNLHSFLLTRGHDMTRQYITDLITGVTRGLKYIHSLNISHRDLKTDNIMVQWELGVPVPKIGDFDHALHRDFPPQVFDSKTFGTPPYLAPEIVLGNPPFTLAQYMAHDIYTLGLLIWECTTWTKCRHSINALGEQGVPLISQTTQSSLHTTDIGQMRKQVLCSTSTHVPLIRELCKVLNLKFHKQDKTILWGGVLVNKARPINLEMMCEFFTKDATQRPVLFRGGDGWTKAVNEIMQGCWAGVGRRQAIDWVMESIDTLRDNVY